MHKGQCSWSAAVVVPIKPTRGQPRLLLFRFMRITVALAQQPLKLSLFILNGPQGISQSPALLLQSPDVDTRIAQNQSPRRLPRSLRLIQQSQDIRLVSGDRILGKQLGPLRIREERLCTRQHLIVGSLGVLQLSLNLAPALSRFIKFELQSKGLLIDRAEEVWQRIFNTLREKPGLPLTMKEIGAAVDLILVLQTESDGVPR